MLPYLEKQLVTERTGSCPANCSSLRFHIMNIPVVHYKIGTVPILYIHLSVYVYVRI